MTVLSLFNWLISVVLSFNYLPRESTIEFCLFLLCFHSGENYQVQNYYFISCFGCKHYSGIIHHFHFSSGFSTMTWYGRLSRWLSSSILEEKWHRYFCLITNKCLDTKGTKGKGFPYSLKSVGSGADPGVVSPQVTISHSLGGSLPFLSAMPAVTFPATEHHLCPE